ncbi:hypothetical protein EYF80_001277 [Liparis tanakae]|uniref:Uncharacterized protein n=1 Tax=Liparis tanakae TaxID=230148 RepID=A0A4Z2JFA5_9TELE|nr:hypothetical protein EYF80_001277 [Liparis tanakae]
MRTSMVYITTDIQNCTEAILSGEELGGEKSIQGKLVDGFLQPEADERGQGVVENQQDDGIDKVLGGKPAGHMTRDFHCKEGKAGSGVEAWPLNSLTQHRAVGKAESTVNNKHN